jgi:hypothetical protein
MREQHAQLGDAEDPAFSLALVLLAFWEVLYQLLYWGQPYFLRSSLCKEYYTDRRKNPELLKG